MKTVHVCTGGCGGKVTEEEYKAGTTSCGAESCTNHGKPFEKKMECEQCGAVIKEDEKHSH